MIYIRSILMATILKANNIIFRCLFNSFDNVNIIITVNNKPAVTVYFISHEDINYMVFALYKYAYMLEY